MKVSKKQMEETRKAIISATVDVVTEKGFPSATMREISKKAGVGDATIYKYFPTKEKILFAYFEEKLNETITLLAKIPEFKKFNLQEKFQTLIETQLEIFLNDREFVQQAFDLVYRSPMSSYSFIKPIRTVFLDEVHEYISEAIEKKEIEFENYPSVIENLSWDYYLSILIYWIKDDSEIFVNTTQLIDKSLTIVYEVLKQGLLEKIGDLTNFLFKAHFFRYIESMNEAKKSSKVINTVKWAKEKIKQELEESNSESK